MTKLKESIPKYGEDFLKGAKKINELKPEVFYTGGGIWLSEADLGNGHYAVISSDMPEESFGVFRYADEQYMPEDMVFTENELNLTGYLFYVYNKLYDAFRDKGIVDYKKAKKENKMANKKTRKLKEAESYGWVVDDNDAWEAYEFACDYFGEENLNEQIISAISHDELAACLAYIFRMNDFREWEAYKNGEELDESYLKEMDIDDLDPFYSLDSYRKETDIYNLDLDEMDIYDLDLDSSDIKTLKHLAGRAKSFDDFVDSVGYMDWMLDYDDNSIDKILRIVYEEIKEFGESRTRKSTKKTVKESKGNNWRGCKNIQMVSHGSWGDPDLVYDGYTFNYWDIEGALWNEFLEYEGINEEDTYVMHGDTAIYSDEYEEKFDKYCQARAEDYLDDVIAGGYFEDGKKTWHESNRRK